MLALRRATELAPGDLATWRAAAQILAEIGSPETLVAQEQLTRLAPQDMALRLAVAEVALLLGRFDPAEATLGGLDAAARRDVAFHRLGGGAGAGHGPDRGPRPGTAGDFEGGPCQPRMAPVRPTLVLQALWGSDLPAAHLAGEAEPGETRV